MKHLDMSATLKTTLAKENLEMQKLEKSKRAHIRMIASSGAKVKMKQNAQEPIVNSSGDVDVSFLF